MMRSDVAVYNNVLGFIDDPLQKMPVLRQATFDRKKQIPIAKTLSYQTSQFERTDINTRIILLKRGKRPFGC